LRGDAARVGARACSRGRRRTGDRAQGGAASGRAAHRKARSGRRRACGGGARPTLACGGGRRAGRLAPRVIDRRRVALLVVALVAARALLPLLLLDPSWEYHRDELLYFAMGDHLAWRMQFPPFIAVLAKLGTLMFGDS